MSSRIEKIQTLVELAEVEEDKALQTFSTIQGQFQDHLQQLETLRSYINEYSHSSSQSTISPVQMLSTQAFVSKLHHAVTEEENKTDGFRDVMERAREAWVEKRSRSQALNKLLLKLKQTHQARLDKQEQRFMDELSGQTFTRNSQKR